jgi:hypothetical protein
MYEQKRAIEIHQEAIEEANEKFGDLDEDEKEKAQDKFNDLIE